MLLKKTASISYGYRRILNPHKYDQYDEMVTAFVERRKGKTTEEQAREQLLEVNYFGTMLVYMDKAEGLVSGAIHSTGETVRPALQIIKTRQISRTSGAFIMLEVINRQEKMSAFLIVPSTLTRMHENFGRRNRC